MKIILLLICSYAFFQTSYSQTDTIVKFYDFRWKETTPDVAIYHSVSFKKDTIWQRYDFFTDLEKIQMSGYYRDSEFKIPIGRFTYYRRNGSIESKGSYSNGKKIGIWTSYSETNQLEDSILYDDGIIQFRTSYNDDGSVSEIVAPNEKGIMEAKGFFSDKTIKHQGQYQNGKRDGDWVFNSEKGKLVVRYAADSVLHYSCFDKNNNLTEDCIYERDAEPVGGKKGWMNYLSKNLYKYAPTAYFKGQLAGTVFVKFIVDKEGNVTNMTVAGSTEPKLNEAALKVISKSPKWKPAVQYNRIVNSYQTQPLTFERATEEE